MHTNIKKEFCACKHCASWMRDKLKYLRACYYCRDTMTESLVKDFYGPLMTCSSKRKQSAYLKSQVKHVLW